jgi:hypothetical protein
MDPKNEDPRHIQHLDDAAALQRAEVAATLELMAAEATMPDVAALAEEAADAVLAGEQLHPTKLAKLTNSQTGIELQSAAIDVLRARRVEVLARINTDDAYALRIQAQAGSEDLVAHNARLDQLLEAVREHEGVTPKVGLGEALGAYTDPELRENTVPRSMQIAWTIENQLAQADELEARHPAPGGGLAVTDEPRHDGSVPTVTVDALVAAVADLPPTVLGPRLDAVAGWAHFTVQPVLEERAAGRTDEVRDQRVTVQLAWIPGGELDHERCTVKTTDSHGEPSEPPGLWRDVIASGEMPDPLAVDREDEPVPAAAKGLWPAALRGDVDDDN